VSGAALRKAGESMWPGGDAGEETAVYTRFAMPDEDYANASPGQASPGVSREERDWDEVDELFRGGGRG